MHFIHVRGHSSDDGNDRADALVQWGKKKPDRSRLREHSPSWQEEIIITREGPIESDGTYGRLAMEEQAREKKEKERQKEEAERNSTSRRRQKQPSVGAVAQHHQTPNDPEPSSGRIENPGSNDDARASSSSNTSSSSNRGTPSGHSSRRRERRRRSACERKSMFVE